MESRIILSTADFSANNIGRYVILSDLTKKVLAKQTQYDEQSDEAVALNTFLDALTSDGFIGGDNPLLKNLLIPALAADHSQFLYDILTLDNDGYPTDLMNSDEKNAASADQIIIPYKDSSNRIIGITAVSSAYDPEDKLKISTNLFKDVSVEYQYSLVCYVPRQLTSDYDVTIMRNYPENYIIKIESEKSIISWVNQPSNATISKPINPRFTKGFYGTSVSGITTTPSVVLMTDTGTIGETIVTGEQLSRLKTQADSRIFSILTKANSISLTTSQSILAFGNSLTLEQMTTLKGYIDTLMVALHVKTE